MLLTQRTTWKKLETHAESLQYQTAIPTQEAAFIQTDAIILDYTHQALDNNAISLLIDLAKECRIPEQIAQLMGGGQ